MTLPTRAFKEVAKTWNIHVYCLERGFFPGTVFVDRQGVNSGSHFSKTWNRTKNGVVTGKAEKIIMDYLQEIHLQSKSITGPENSIGPREIRKRFGIPEGKKIVLYAAQIDSDTNIIFYSQKYNNNKDLILKLQDIIRRHENACLLIKLHPEDINRQNEFKKLLSSDSVIVDDISIQSLLQAVDIVVVRNSTVGLEALTYFKPVITLGNALYSHKGFTYDVSTDEDLAETMKFLLNGGHNLQDIRNRVIPFLFSLLTSNLYFIDGQGVFKGSNKKIEEECLNKATGENSLPIKNEKPSFPAFKVYKPGPINIIKPVPMQASLKGKEKQNILLIIENVDMPLKILTRHLSTAEGNANHITVIGHKLLEKGDLEYNRFYPFTFFNMLKCLIKPWDFLLFASPCSIGRKMSIYLALARSKNKIIINPFNINNLIRTCNE